MHFDQWRGNIKSQSASGTPAASPTFAVSDSRWLNFCQKVWRRIFFWNWQSTLMYILYPKNIFYLPWSPRNGKLIPQGVKFYKELPSLIELLFIFEKLFSKNQIGSKNQVQAKQKIKFIQFTQPNWTLFFLIFTYLRCRSH